MLSVDEAVELEEAKLNNRRLAVRLDLPERQLAQVVNARRTAEPVIGDREGNSVRFCETGEQPEVVEVLRVGPPPVELDVRPLDLDEFGYGFCLSEAK